MVLHKIKNSPNYLKLYPPLSKEVEYTLIRRAKKGDRKALDKLLLHHLSYVQTYAFKVLRTNTSLFLEDLMQEGSLALFRAFKKFDINAGVRFGTYSTFWIKALLRKYAQENSSVVIPRSNTWGTVDASLDKPVIGPEGSETTFESFVSLLPDDRPIADSVLVDNNTSQLVQTALSKLKARLGPVGWDVVQHRLMKDGYAHTDDTESLSLAVIGKKHGISREAVRLTEVKVRVLLKKYLSDCGLESLIRDSDNVVSIKQFKRERIRRVMLPRKCCGSKGPRHKAGCPESRKTTPVRKPFEEVLPVHSHDSDETCTPICPVWDLANPPQKSMVETMTQLDSFKEGLKKLTIPELRAGKEAIEQELVGRLKEAEENLKAVREAMGISGD